MRLSTQVLWLYFTSEDGSRLTEGFLELASIPMDGEPTGGDETAEVVEGALSNSDSSGSNSATEVGDDSAAVKDDEEPVLSSSAHARIAIDQCFEGAASECVQRTLMDIGEKQPSSLAEARELYSRLLERGLVILGRDFERFISSRAAFHNELAKMSEGEGEDVETDGTEDASAVDGAEAEDPNEELCRLGGTEDDALKLWAQNIAPISWALHCFAPEWFVPYAFVHSFHQFEAICDEFGIPLPRLPGKAGCAERARYYLELNDALQEFRSAHEMAPAEFNSFLYGFCVDQVPQDELAELLPAQRAWFLMAAPEGDFELLDDATDESRSHWQAHYDVRPGDIGIMWCRSPRSSVHSIWRATSRGFADPFFFHYRTAWIGHAQLVAPISFRELQADPTWAVKPATRAHFQNCSGKEVTFEEYEALLRILEAKGFDTKALPRIERRHRAMPEAVESERDVEEKLLEPFLDRLGYSGQDWVRQLPLRMGRGERFYPDYAIGTTGRRGEESATMIAEAKFRITTVAQLREAYLQARSYAERLRVDVFLLCALDGVWLFQRKRDRFEADRHVFHPWSEVADAKVFCALDDLIGKQSNLWRKANQAHEDA